MNGKSLILIALVALGGAIVARSWFVSPEGEVELSSDSIDGTETSNNQSDVALLNPEDYFNEPATDIPGVKDVPAGNIGKTISVEEASQPDMNVVEEGTSYGEFIDVDGPDGGMTGSDLAREIGEVITVEEAGKPNLNSGGQVINIGETMDVDYLGKNYFLSAEDIKGTNPIFEKAKKRKAGQ